MPDLQHVPLSADQVLYEPGVVMRWAYFLDTATVSILSQAERGASIEVSLVGNEGVIGIPIVLGTLKLPYQVVVHGPGTARRMKADVLRKEFVRECYGIIKNRVWPLLSPIGMSVKSAGEAGARDHLWIPAEIAQLTG